MTYIIYIHSNEHPRTINTPRMARTYFTSFSVHGDEELVAKVNELREQGEFITEISTPMGRRIFVIGNKVYKAK